jgi:CheY-like chemotaxis protein
MLGVRGTPLGRNRGWRAAPHRPCSTAVLLWLIDDTEVNQTVAETTVALVPGAAFRGFLVAAEAIAAFARAARRPATLPEVVLMDFYLGDTRGDEVARRLRALEPATRRPVIVGYSSVASGSAAILAAGGDLVLRKHADGRGVNPSLLAWLRARGAR